MRKMSVGRLVARRLVRPTVSTTRSFSSLTASSSAAPVIDVHAHVVLRDSLGAAGSYGPEVGASETGEPWFRIGSYYLRGVRYEGSPFMDVNARLERMDRDGIDFQLLSPNPLTYFHHIPREEAVAFCRQHNDALAAVVAEHPSRLGGLAALPMQCPTSAAAELTRAVDELGLLVRTLTLVMETCKPV